MATNLTIAQSNPSAASLTSLYTVPADTASVCSSLVVCNRSATATTFRVAIRNAGAVINDAHYIYYDVEIPGNDTFAATLGLVLPADTVVSVYATLATLSFNLFIEENS